MDCSKVGALIRALREEAGLTQLQLAEKLGVSDRAVSKWECGRGAPDVTLLGALSAALKVNVEGLLAGELPGGAACLFCVLRPIPPRKQLEFHL